MTNDFIIWLDGAPVVVTPGGETFQIWLDNAPVIQPGGDDAIAVVSGTEIITETGTVTATGGAVATVTGSECLTETGDCGVTGSSPCTGEEVITETGTVIATGGASAVVTGEECTTETGIVTVTVTPPIPPIPPTFGGYAVFHRQTKRNKVYKFPKSKLPQKERYRRRKKEDSESVLEVEITPDPVVLQAFESSIAIARVQGSECRTSTGICNVRVDYPDDLETIKLIQEIMEIQAGLETDEKSPKNEEKSNEYSGSALGTDEEDLELILMIEEMA